MKKLYLLFITSLLCFTAMAETNIPNNTIYYTTTDGTICSPYRKGVDIFGGNIISNTYENGQGVITFDAEVKSIGEYAFFQKDKLTSVVIPNSVTNIANDAFAYCESLASVNIPINISSIGGTAFRNCALTSVDIPDNVKNIGDCAFNDCKSLTSVNIGNGVKDIGGYAFQGCYNLSSLVIGDSVTSIGENAFSACSALYKISIPSSVTSIGKDAFTGTGWLNTQPDGPICLDNCLIMYKGISPSDAFVVKDETRIIADNAFYQCNFISIDLPNSVTHIGKHAFTSCGGLVLINIPNSVTSIGDYAFYYCGRLSSITIPNGVTSIGEGTFMYCHKLGEVVIPNSVTSIGYEAFFNCSGLTSLTIGNNVTDIGGRAFDACHRLTSISIPNSVENIWDGAFAECEKVTSITIGNSVKIIGEEAFKLCEKVKTITCKATIPPICGRYCFSGVDSAKLYVPEGSVDKYKNNTTDYDQYGWKKFTDIEEISISTDLSQFSNILFIEESSAFSGLQATLSMKMNNNVPMTGFQCDIYMPDGISIAMDEDEYYLIDLSTERTTAKRTNTFDSALQPDGSIRILAGSTKSYAFEGTEGEVATITVNINESLEEGEYPLILRNVVMSDAEGKTYKIGKVTTMLKVMECQLGDPNKDGDVNIGDYTTIANHILGKTPETFVQKAADVNCDGEINVGDLTALANLILYGSTPAQAKPRFATDDEALIYINDTTMTAGEEIDLSVKMKNDVPMTGFQFDVIMPEGLSIATDEDGYYFIDLSTERTTARNTNTFDSALQTDGSVRVLAGSTKSKTFEGTDGEVCTITVKAAEGIADGTYTVVLKNIVMSDATGKTYKVDRSEATVTIDTTTGIAAVKANSLGNGKYLKDGKLIIVRNGKQYSAVGLVK